MLSGLYRGTVRGNVDPDQLCRLQVAVPDAHTEIAHWATPCAPMGGARDFGAVVIPPVGANVWVMFEKGQPEHPVWMGTFWDPAEPPPGSSEAQRIFKTLGLTVDLSDIPGSPTLKLSLSTGATIIIGSAGIVLSNGQGASLVMEGPTVTINYGAFTVT